MNTVNKDESDSDFGPLVFEDDGNPQALSMRLTNEDGLLPPDETTLSDEDNSSPHEIEEDTFLPDEYEELLSNDYKPCSRVNCLSILVNPGYRVLAPIESKYFDSLRSEFFTKILDQIDFYGLRGDTERMKTLQYAYAELVELYLENKENPVRNLHNKLCEKVREIGQRDNIRKLDLDNFFRKLAGVLIIASGLGNIAWVFKGARQYFFQSTSSLSKAITPKPIYELIPLDTKLSINNDG